MTGYWLEYPIADTSTLKYLCRDYFKAKVCTTWALGPLAVALKLSTIISMGSLSRVCMYARTQVGKQVRVYAQSLNLNPKPSTLNNPKFY